MAKTSEHRRPVAKSPRLLKTIDDLRVALRDIRSRGGRLGLVPTMGALHEGHLSLVRASRSECQTTIVTIFVNPIQFGPREDLERYPRTMDADMDLLAKEKVDLVFAPSPTEIYPAGFSTYVEPPSVSLPFEGKCRPGHFRGVATVVLKLFHLIPADVAFFGQKDYQQCLVIRRMVQDLDLPIEVRMCPIVREPDGLALSSRNRYLLAAERWQALALSNALATGRKLIENGERRGPVVREQMRGVLAEAGITSVDYVTVADPLSLAELDTIPRQAVLLIAAHVGETRLIDNCLVG